MCHTAEQVQIRDEAVSHATNSEVFREMHRQTMEVMKAEFGELIRFQGRAADPPDEDTFGAIFEGNAGTMELLVEEFAPRT